MLGLPVSLIGGGLSTALGMVNVTTLGHCSTVQIRSAATLASYPFCSCSRLCSAAVACLTGSVIMQALLALDSTAKRCLQTHAESYGLPVSTFETVLNVTEEEAPASRLEAIQYTLHGSTAACHTSCREHIDRGLLTLIYSDCGQGLQVGCVLA